MHTGDLAVMHENGYVNISGRLKDMIIRGGENIYPREIEEFLYTHPKVSEVQVIGVPDLKYGEELCAWIRLRDGQTRRKTSSATSAAARLRRTRSRDTSGSRPSFRPPSPGRSRSSRCAKSRSKNSA